MNLSRWNQYSSEEKRDLLARIGEVSQRGLQFGQLADPQCSRCGRLGSGTCLRAFRSFETLQGQDGRAWQLAVVRNTCFTWLKKKGTSPR